MARILYWNINNFTNEKIAAASKKRSREDVEWGAGPRGPTHLQIILDTLQAVNPVTGNPAALDFIVIVEIYSRMGLAGEGSPIAASGLAGCTNLLNQINNDPNIPGNGNWSLVPPIVTGQNGQREAIAVYYNSNNWYFLGPNTWPFPYGPALDNGLPNRVIPVTYPYVPGVIGATSNERRRAGRYRFGTWVPGGMPNHNPGLLVQFPGAANRKPWLTCFGDINNDDNLVRIMSLHTKPNDLMAHVNYANQATTNLADIYDMTARPADAANQIDVIVGDFNVNNLTAGNFLAGGPFGRLVGAGANPVAPAYTALIQPPAMLNPNYESYYHTHGRTAGGGDEQAEILEDTVVAPFWQPVGHYPGQEYSGLSIDNALVRYLGGAAPPANYNTTILARARQQPYNAPGGMPVPMLGHYQSDVYMDETIGDIYNLAPNLIYDLNEQFREWDNYGKVYSTSDHFALLFDI
jgi:hypothetical protein